MVNVETPNANKNAPTTGAANGESEEDDSDELVDDETAPKREYAKAPRYLDWDQADPQFIEGEGDKRVLKAWPTNIDIDTHRIAKKDVKDELIYLEFKVRRMEASANAILERAKQSREKMAELSKIGDLEVRKLVSDQFRMQAKMAKIAKQIEEAKAKAAQG